MQATFGRPVSALFGRQYALSNAAPADACAALTNPADVAGTVVLVLRGTCTFAVKVPALSSVPAAPLPYRCLCLF